MSSCKTLRPHEMFQTKKDYPIAEFESSRIEYIIQPYDKISIKLLSNDGTDFFGTGTGNNTSGNSNTTNNGYTFPVEYDGKVKLPVIGRVEISGKTIRQAEELLETLYSDYFQQPFVLVSVTNRKITLFMNGGTKANTITMTTDHMTLVEAIAMCGGLTQSSKAYRIKLIRGDITNKPQVYYWNVRSLEALNNSNVLLEANDIIYIESKPQYVTRVLSEISPYLTLVTTFASIYGIFYSHFKK